MLWRAKFHLVEGASGRVGELLLDPDVVTSVVAAAATAAPAGNHFFDFCFPFATERHEFRFLVSGYLLGCRINCACAVGRCLCARSAHCLRTYHFICF